MGFKAGIWALRLGSESEGRGTVEEEKEKKEEKIPHMCESIGHQPLSGSCPAPPLTKYLQKSGMSAGIMFAVIGSIVMPFFLFEKLNMVIMKNKKHI